MVDASPKEWDELRKKHPELIQKYENFLDEVGDDPVNNPNHYNTGGVECIEGIESSMSPNAFLGYLKGNCMKYMWRYEYKGKPLEDLEKAQWYLNLLIERIK